MLVVLAATSLGAALQVRDGLYSPLAVSLLILTIALACIALATNWRDGRTTRIVAALALLMQLALLCCDFPGSHHIARAPREYAVFIALMSLAACAVMIAIVMNRRRVDHCAFAALLVLHLIAGVWVLRQTPAPFMDVFVFQRDASAALRAGINPYTIDFPNIYGESGAFVYGEGLSRNGRLQFGFPYTPHTAMWNFLGDLIAPDYRYLNQAAILIAGLLLALSGNGRMSYLGAALLLFTPRSFYIIEQGWTEPLSILLLSATIFSAARRPALAPYFFGLLLASKQYLAIALVLTPLLAMRWDWRFVLKAIATASIVTAPLALWDIRAFWANAIMLQFHQPFRTDALSLSAAAVNVGLPRMPSVVAPLASIAVGVVLSRKLPPSPWSFALALAVMYLTLFALSKQAFANYYFLVIAAFCAAICTSESRPLTSEPAIVR